jgi:hypothetical protein
MLPELPQGDGLAADYPGDEDIEQDAAVVFYDGFESNEVGPLPGGRRRGNEKRWDNSSGNWIVTDDPALVHGGRGHALEVNIPRPGPKPAGAGADKHFTEGFDTLFLRYYANFAAENELYHGGAHNGGGIAARAPGVPQACPGVRADGSNKYTIVLDTWRPEPEVASPGYLVTYVYHMDQGGRWGDQFFPSGRVYPGTRDLFGPEFTSREDYIPEQGGWHCYELMVRANEPGLRDGRIAFWVDGVLRADFPSLRLRNVSSLKANRINIGVYTHNSRVQKDIRMWYDDVVAATSYIGPQRELR